MNLGSSLLIANLFSENTFGLGAWNFLTSNEQVGSSIRSSDRITLKELIAGSQGGSLTGTHHLAPMNKAWSNMKKNSTEIGMAVIGIPIAMRIAKKLLRKPIITPANKLLKMAGLNEVKLG